MSTGCRITNIAVLKPDEFFITFVGCNNNTIRYTVHRKTGPNGTLDLSCPKDAEHEQLDLLFDQDFQKHIVTAQAEVYPHSGKAIDICAADGKPLKPLYCINERNEGAAFAAIPGILIITYSWEFASGHLKVIQLSDNISDGIVIYEEYYGRISDPPTFLRDVITNCIFKATSKSYLAKSYALID